MPTGDLLASGLISGFLLALPALFSIVNPVGSALVFNQMLASRSHTYRVMTARRVAIYALIVLVTSFWVGGLILTFFGISLPALRLAGGLVVVHQAWLLLTGPASGKEKGTTEVESEEDITFFPLTMPITTGPGTISVAIALTAARPANSDGHIGFVIGLTLAALVIAMTVWISDRYAESVISLLGRPGVSLVMRLTAFILLCVGMQIIIEGGKGVFS